MIMLFCKFLSIPNPNPNLQFSIKTAVSLWTITMCFRNLIKLKVEFIYLFVTQAQRYSYVTSTSWRSSVVVSWCTLVASTPRDIVSHVARLPPTTHSSTTTRCRPSGSCCAAGDSCPSGRTMRRDCVDVYLRASTSCTHVRCSTGPGSVRSWGCSLSTLDCPSGACLI